MRESREESVECKQAPPTHARFHGASSQGLRRWPRLEEKTPQRTLQNTNDIKSCFVPRQLHP